MNSVNVLTNEKNAVKNVEKEENVVTTAKKAVVKKAIAKAVKVEKEDMKKAVEQKTIEKDTVEKRENAKKEVVKKETTKKTTAKKSTTAKKATAPDTKKEEVMGTSKEEIFIQTSSNEMSLDAIVEKVKKAYIAEGNAESKDDKIRIYVKPEENMVYYVVNDSYASGINLFEE